MVYATFNNNNMTYKIDMIPFENAQEFTDMNEAEEFVFKSYQQELLKFEQKHKAIKAEFDKFLVNQLNLRRESL